MTSLPLTAKDRVITMRRALEIAGERCTFSTGSAALDGLLGGGFTTGEISEVFGASNTGKTQLAMQSAISAAVEGYSCLFVDTEGQFRPERLSTLCESREVGPGAVLSAVFSTRAETAARQLETIRKLRREGPRSCKLVVVDTLTKNFTLEYPGGKLAGRRQTALGAYLNALSRDAYEQDRAVVVLNRVASVTLEGNDVEVDIGGETVRRFAQKVLYLRRSGDYVMASRPDLGGPEVRTSITERGLV